MPNFENLVSSLFPAIRAFQLLKKQPPGPDTKRCKTPNTLRLQARDALTDDSHLKAPRKPS